MLKITRYNQNKSVMFIQKSCVMTRNILDVSICEVEIKGVGVEVEKSAV